MKAFGLELRQANSISNLLSDVDRVLLANGITPGSGSVSITFKAKSCAVALQRMFRGDTFFDVCTLRDCAKVFNLIIPAERMNIYTAVHCTHWNKMDPEYRQMLTALILDDFRDVIKLAD